MLNVFDGQQKNKELHIELLESIEQLTSTASWCLSISTNELHCSGNFKKMIGVKSRKQTLSPEVLAKNIHEQDKEKIHHWMRSVKAQKTECVDFRIVHSPNESERTLRLQPIGYKTIGEQLICYGILQELQHPSSEVWKEKEQTENALQKAEQKYKHELESEIEKRVEELNQQAVFIAKITSTVPDMLSIINLPTRAIRFINDEEFRNHGFDPEQMHKSITTKLRYLVHPDDLVVLDNYYQNLAEAEDEEIVTAEYRAKGSRPEWAWFHVRGKVFTRNEQGGVEDVLNVIENITERKANREALDKLNHTLAVKNRELESLASELQTFTSIAATDFKEPLQNVYTALELIVTGEAANLSNNGRANLRRAQSALQRLHLLTDDIIAYANVHKQAPQISEVNLNDIMRQVLDDLRAPITNSAAVIKYGDLPSIKGDALQLHLLFNHILSNAIKFRKEQDVPLILIECSTKEEVNEEGPYLCHLIKVKDNGIGFPEEEAARIFNIFVKLNDKKYKGSGTGLAICKKIMEQHGGTIKTFSAPNEGTTIECCFPVK